MSKNVINWATVGVRAPKDSENIWDRQATLDKITADFDVFEKMQNTDTGKIRETLLSMFAGPKAKVSYNSAAIVGVIMGEIGYDDQTYVPLRKRVEEVIADNDRVFSVKGPGGGTKFMSDEDYAVFKETGLNPAETLSAAKKDLNEKVKALKAAAKA